MKRKRPTKRCRHRDGFTALWWHYGPYGPQDVHLHSCFTEGCYRVIIGTGRACDKRSVHHRETLT